MTQLTIKKGSKMTSIINTVDAVEIIEETAQEAQDEVEQENVQIAPVEVNSATPGEVCEEDNALAPFVGTALDGIETDIDLELATRAHNGTSFSPEQRGRGEVANSFGLHWVLIGVLSRYGFRTNGTKEAEVLAGDIITCWYQLQK